jgi:transposase
VPGAVLDDGERAELARLRKAEREWPVEKGILLRAAAYFAREMK